MMKLALFIGLKLILVGIVLSFWRSATIIEFRRFPRVRRLLSLGLMQWH